MNLNFKYSYNSLSKLVYEPTRFYKEYILGEKEKVETKYFTEGELIHFMVLQRDECFDDNYIITSNNLPSPNAMQIIEVIFAADNTGTLDDHKDEINTRLEAMNLYQSVKDYDKRVGKICDDTGREYWEFLKNKDGKKIITNEMFIKCQERAQKVRDNYSVMSILGAYDERLHVYNEYPIEIDKYNNDDDVVIGLKGIIDNFTVNEETKTVTINDFKTTSKVIQGFKDSVEMYMYWMQAAIYRELIRVSMELDDEWKIEFNFVVFDKNDNLYIYNVTNETMATWINNLHASLEHAKWHMLNDRYDLPYEFANGLIKL